MSPLEILEQLLKLTPTERETIRIRLDELETAMSPPVKPEPSLDSPRTADWEKHTEAGHA
jgi:hypothetical protein